MRFGFLIDKTEGAAARLTYDIRKRFSFLKLDCPDWVNVIALTDEDQVVLVRQYRLGTERITLEIPGGVVDSGEEPAAAAAQPPRIKPSKRSCSPIPKNGPST